MNSAHIAKQINLPELDYQHFYCIDLITYTFLGAIQSSKQLKEFLIDFSTTPIYSSMNQPLVKHAYIPHEI